MHDKAAGRAAPYATPADLAVRDWLLAALSLATGIYEAICFLTFGKVFTAAQTGNLVLLGISVADTRQPAGPNSLTVLISFAAFAAGAVLATPVLRSSGADQEIAGKDILQAWPRRVTIVLAIALVLEVGFLAIWITATSPAKLAYILIALSGFAMGLQMNAVRSLHVPSISATAFTATFVSLASGLAAGSLTAPSARRLAATMISVAAGAFLGDWLLTHAHRYAPLVPAIVTAVVIVIASVTLHGRLPGP